MRILNVKQNSDEWLDVRSGIPTASAFGKIVTGKGKKSDQREGYMYELARGQAGIAKSFGGNESTERGHELEPEAANWYSAMNDVDTLEVGFIVSDCGLYGGSPDRLVGSFGGLEIKCCEEKEHVRMFNAGILPIKHRPQVYGLLWLTQRKWWDFLAYHPEHPQLEVRTKRSDPDYQAWVAAFVPRLNEFNAQLTKLKQELGLEAPY